MHRYFKLLKICSNSTVVVPGKFRRVLCHKQHTIVVLQLEFPPHISHIYDYVIQYILLQHLLYTYQCGGLQYF